MKPSAEEIRQWVEDPTQWPTADSYSLSSLEPCPALKQREEILKKILPSWFFNGEAGQSLLSVGPGKCYFERKYFRDFEHIYMVESSEKSRRLLEYIPIHNGSYAGTSLFSAAGLTTCKYGWLGACIHYLYGEFYGWEFMHRLGMMVHDSLVIDGGTFERHTPQGKLLTETWAKRRGVSEDYNEIHLAQNFNYQKFKEVTKAIWRIEFEADSGWTPERKTLILKRELPPVIQLSQLGERQAVKTHNFSSRVFRVAEGYFKNTPVIDTLLQYDVVSKVMGWDFLKYRVYDGSQYVGFVTRDLGDEVPDDRSASTDMFLSLFRWCFPLGIIPTDTALENIRIKDGTPALIEIALNSLSRLNAQDAHWTLANITKVHDGNRPTAHGQSQSDGPAVVGQPDKGGLAPAPRRFGTREIEFVSASAVSATSASPLILSGDKLVLRLAIRSRIKADDVTIGFSIANIQRQSMFGTNTRLLGYRLSLDPGGQYEIVFEIPNQLGRGTYAVEVAAFRGSSHLLSAYDLWERAAKFEVVGNAGLHFEGAVKLYPNVSFESGNGSTPDAAWVSVIHHLHHSLGILNRALDDVAYRISAPRAPEKVDAGEAFQVPITLHNTGAEPIPGIGMRAILVSYHWRTAAGDMVVQDGERTSFLQILAPGASCRMHAKVIAPSDPGSYILELCLVQEGLKWFDGEGAQRLPMRVIVPSRPED
jgi:hypothetical protein